MSKLKDTTECDILVIGAGPGGLSAAAAAKKQGAALGQCPAERQAANAAKEFRTGDQDEDHLPGQDGLRVVVLERDEIAGGILNQCVHDGFGIVRYGAQLSGPEYAQIEWEKALDAGVEILTGCMVTEIVPAGKGNSETREFDVTAISRSGRKVFRTRSIVLATGCRERTRGMLSIPGTRPAGIYTAGVAQNLINRKNLMVGRRVVILGSGDIGLIMARRLTLEGAQVLCVAEVMREPSGLARNVRQCLFDYSIPLYLNTTVSNIIGRGRLQAVELSRVDDRLQPVSEAGHRIYWPAEGEKGTGNVRELQQDEILRIDCDTLILSVGLIPENEVAKTAGVALDPGTNGALTDEYLQTSVPGIFACGNARAVMDLADFVSEQGETAGINAALYAKAQDQPLHKWTQDLHNAARKGLPKEGSVTCTLCPKGCQCTVRRAEQHDAEGALPGAGNDPGIQMDRADTEWIVTGNSCPRGEVFARQELTDPHRILTTTIHIEDGDMLLPVRSDRPVPLCEMQELVRQVRKHKNSLPPGGIRKGDVLIQGLGRDKVNIISETTLDPDAGSV